MIAQISQNRPCPRGPLPSDADRLSQRMRTRMLSESTRHQCHPRVFATCYGQRNR